MLLMKIIFQSNSSLYLPSVAKVLARSAQPRKEALLNLLTGPGCQNKLCNLTSFEIRGYNPEVDSKTISLAGPGF